VRAEFGRFNASADYSRFRHQQRHLAHASFELDGGVGRGPAGGNQGRSRLRQ
jgi:hypothetical protein